VRGSDLDRLRGWFEQYTRTFFLDDASGQKNIDLKIEHTRCVCSIIVNIAAGQSLSMNQTLIAETAALFHDVGRFPQYKKYRTFRDSVSVNHGKLGAEILAEEGILGDLPSDEQTSIMNAVRFHNAVSLPSLDSRDDLLFLKMVRDADKLDIWRIFLGFYEGDPVDVASESGLGLPDLPEYSDLVIADIRQKRTALMKNLRTLNDFKLMQMSWVYDLNFKSSLRLMAERNYINRLADLLPATDEIAAVRASLLSYIDGSLHG